MKSISFQSPEIEHEWHRKFQYLIKSPYSEGSIGIFPHLIGIPQTQFFKEFWERMPLHCNRSKFSSDITAINSLFSSDNLKSIVSSRHLLAENNIKFVKYSTVDCIRREKEMITKSFLTVTDIKRSFKKGFSAQFFQPQRFSDELHQVNASFEYYLGTLAGASAYLTPQGSQGLAPHYDDVEVFILQTEGIKMWNLWWTMDLEVTEDEAKRLSDEGLLATEGWNHPIFFRLPESYSRDLDRGILETLMRNPNSSLPSPPLPSPSPPPESLKHVTRIYTAQLTLRTGDLLYLPRGVIHEARSDPSTPSTHITISAYQHHSLKRLLGLLLPRLLDQAFTRAGCHLGIQEGEEEEEEEDGGIESKGKGEVLKELRRGLPRRVGELFGSFPSLNRANPLSPPLHNGGKEKGLGRMGSREGEGEREGERRSFIRVLKTVLRALPLALSEGLVDEATDELSEDFAAHRLPPPCRPLAPPPLPPPSQGEGAGEGEGHLSRFSLVDPRLLFIKVQTPPDGEEGEGGLLLVSSAVDREREGHMGHPSEPSQGEGEGEEEEEEEGDGGWEGGDEEEEGEGLWSAVIPVRYLPLIQVLIQERELRDRERERDRDIIHSLPETGVKGREEKRGVGGFSVSELECLPCLLSAGLGRVELREGLRALWGAGLLEGIPEGLKGPHGGKGKVKRKGNETGKSMREREGEGEEGRKRSHSLTNESIVLGKEKKAKKKKATDEKSEGEGVMGENKERKPTLDVSEIEFISVSQLLASSSPPPSSGKNNNNSHMKKKSIGKK